MTAVVQRAASMRRRLPAPTRRLGWSEGDAWTVGIGLVLALALAVSTIPAVLDARGGAPRAAAPSADGPVAPEPAAPGALPDAVVALPPPPVTQPLLDPLVPLAPPAGADDERSSTSQPATASSSSAPPPPAPGEVRQFAALPAGGRPGAVAAAPDGSVWAGTDAPAQDGAAAELLTWDATGVLKKTAQVPDQPAGRTRGLTGIVPLPDGSLAVVDAATSRLLRHDAAARSWTTLAEVPDVAPCLLLTAAPCQPGVLDTAPLLRGVAVDSAGVVFLADAGQGTIWQLAPGKQVEPWWSSADVAGAEGLADLAVDADGHLLAVITRLSAVEGSAAGALLRIERAEDGSAGARTVVAAFQAGEDPVALALGASGNAYVALRGANAVVTLDSTGFEQLRVVDDVLQEPAGVHLVAGRVLVAVAGSAPAVLEVGVDDGPLAPSSPSPTAGGSARD